jgi:hypothetical protein
MTNKRVLLGMLVMVLAFGTMVLGCKSTPPLQPERTGPEWSVAQ